MLATHTRRCASE